MKKKLFTKLVSGRHRLLKTLLFMKFVVILMIISSLQLSAKVYSQNGKFTFSLRNAQFKEVLNNIRVRSSYDFIYRDKDIADVPKIDIKVSNATLKEVLDKCVVNTKIKYTIEGNIILFSKIDKKPESSKIKGKVTDEKGNVLPGVTVMIKGTTVGVSTNIKGEFTINGKKGDVLVISFVGMEKQEVKYQGKTLNVKLKEQTSQLEEVVITGYGKIEKRKLTSSVFTVKGKDVIEAVGTSIDKMLQGKVPGMLVMQQTSTPGAAPKIRIRGSSSITGNREPLWVIDGQIQENPVPISNSDLNSLDKVNLIGNAISFLNPQDIDRIDILKDASATAIYGSRAANGVIVVTTKKGKKGKPRFSYSTSVNVITRPSYDNMFRMNSAERIDVSREMHERGLEFATCDPSRVGYEGALMDLWDRNITLDEFRNKVQYLSDVNTDWYDLLFRNSVSQSHYATMSGGSDRTTYYFSAGINNQKGATIGVDYKQLTSRLNLTTKIRENLKVSLGLSIASTNSNNNHPKVDLYQYAYNTSRAIPAFNPDGSRCFYKVKPGFNHTPSSYYSPDLEFNIFNELEHSDSNTKNKNFSINLGLDWKINSMISYDFKVSASASNSADQNYFGAQTYMAQNKRGLAYGIPDPGMEDKREFFYTYNQLPKGGEIYTKDMNSSSFSVRNALIIRKNFARHSISSRIGTEMRMSSSEGRSLTSYGYLPDRGRTFAIIDAQKYRDFYNTMKRNRPSITDRETRFISFYGTFSYSYDSRYIVNFNIRTDGSNKFGQDKKNRFLPIWSVSGRWNVAEEKWFDDQNILNQFSIRCSYGIQGNVSNDQVPNLILKISDMDDISNEYASKLYKVPNNKLRWEKTTSYDLGLDFSFLNNRIHGAVELYKKLGTDQIVSKDITSTNGAKRVAINAGNVENKGWELSLGTTLLKAKDFSWDLSVNTGKNSNKVTKIGKEVDKQYEYQDYLNGTVVKPGKPINSFYCYMFDKLDENGLPTFKNFNEKDEDGKWLVNSFEEAYKRIMTYAGDRIPDLNGGLSTSIRYKNFSLSSQFAFSFGNKVRLNQMYSTFQRLPYPQQNMESDFVNRWRKPGDEKFTNVPVLSNERLNLLDGSKKRRYEIASSLWEMYNYSDIRVVKGDYMRCRNLSLGYSFNEKALTKIGLKGANLSFSVSNLFVLKSSSLKGRDPEQVSMGSRTIPPQRTYSLSVTANF